VLVVSLTAGLGALYAEQATLQASFGDQRYVLVDRGDQWVLSQEGGEIRTLPAKPTTFVELRALESGWLLAGHRPAPKGPGHELVLLRQGRGAAAEALPVPPAGSSTLIAPSPLVEEGRLIGLAWLEGEDPAALGVRVAAWTGSGFSPAEWVAKPSGRSQLALQAAVLGDGAWLLVWSAFDGVDDEILWSSSGRDGWTAPARVHADNAVPDITPVVVATGSGAVAAWSRFESGQYRVRVSRFHDGSWSDEERVGGPGSLFPFFVGDAAQRGPSLVFSSATEGAWFLLELGARDEVRTRSRWQGPARTRPVVERPASGPARLEWPQASLRTPGEAR
jgi:hypothetical protein